ncbi:hypothetical protein BDP55DRAFT_733103 [Colletotrichum godetiae]|uniref:HNH nuclease domain-containing protein n=1 Tax=Colletotrichum godetiae TaxID=1209918 RepID=A0AAJ0ABU0_9PEZI|nr:uncharacterized protein BDP55DRAFT_733103 [Colletotrichum godetiae]KAK1659633.1 hypothetical protein BDP55DRAFT_733103 [Colletotrichum godetiae]
MNKGRNFIKQRCYELLRHAEFKQIDKLDQSGRILIVTPYKTTLVRYKQFIKALHHHKARDRANNLCVVTKMQKPQVCHIIPFTLSNYPADLFSLILRMKACKNLIDDPANVICLTWQLHKYWTDGKFMLKPRGRPYEVAVVDDSVGPRSARKQKAEEFRWCQEIVIHWLRWTTLEGMQADADYSTDPREHFQPLDHETAVSLETGYSVADGKTIKVFADCEADVPSYVQFSYNYRPICLRHSRLQQLPIRNCTSLTRTV